ncbi:hypothetical protein BD769DRAFT_799162 [Suillus cothurnatus]|nr:hypothetical protein BD769DRAFT_799162 [Suillus cothurnatus]
MENAIHSTAPCALRISGISIDFSDSEKNIESAEARIGKLSRPIAQDVGKTMRQAFSPPIKLSLGDTFSLHLRYRRRFRKIGHEEIHFDLADMLRTSDAGQEYRKSHDNFKIVVILSGNTITDVWTHAFYRKQSLSHRSACRAVCFYFRYNTGAPVHHQRDHPDLSSVPNSGDRKNRCW